MSTEENKAALKRFVDQWDKGNLEIVDELVHPDFIYHRPGMEDVRGRDGMKEWGQQFHAAFSNVVHVFEHLVAEDDHLAFRFTITALHKGEFMRIPIYHYCAS
jgi:predicted ester cyclase